MNRPRKSDRHLPAKMYFKHGRHWYVDRGKWRALAIDLADALREYADIVGTPRGGMGELIDRVMVELQGRKRQLSPNTLEQYRYVAGKLKRAFLEFAPDQVKARHVAAFKLQQQATPGMANRMLSLLRTVFAYAVEWQLVDSNPCIGVKRLEVGARERYVTDEEYQRLRAAADPRMAAVMELCYFTGQRIGDVLAIRTVDLLEDGIAFRQQKTGARLVVMWSPELRAAVQRAREASGGENVRATTLLHRRGKVLTYSGVGDAFARARLRAGVEDVTIHDLRAKALTDAHLQGLDPQGLGGHTNRKQTEAYIRVRLVPRVTPPSFGQSLDTGTEKS